MEMTQKPDSSQKTPQTPFERFTEAARHVFNIPKAQVHKIKAKAPWKPRKRN